MWPKSLYVRLPKPCHMNPGAKQAIKSRANLRRATGRGVVDPQSEISIAIVRRPDLSSEGPLPRNGEREIAQRMKAYTTPKSDQMAKRGRQVIPAASMSNWRRTVDYHPIYMSHGKGARLYDVDGNEYIDYSLSYGPAVLGHDNEHVREALKKQLERLFTPNVNDLEVAAAQLVSRHIQSAELVRFACTGTEANRGALRVARAHTGRDKYVRFNGHYHGGLDHMMGGIVQDPENPVPAPGEQPDDLYSQFANTKGRFKGAFDACYMLEWNDLPALEALLSRHGNEIAAVIMEPVMVNNYGCTPEPGYLEGARELCTRYEVVLIFDEVLTGFRIGLKGAQGHFGVTPDLTTLAKALGAGFPVSSTSGRREVMDALTRADAIQGGTYNGHPLAMAAVIAAIEEYERQDGEVFRHIEHVGNMLKDGLEQIAAEHEQPLRLQGFPGAWTFCFHSKGGIRNQAEGRGADFGKMGRFAELLKERGVITSMRFCTSAAHTEKDVGDTLDRANEVMRILKEEGGRE
jgi:glutamate-1-semialdehyde 2,1-aminomutase